MNLPFRADLRMCLLKSADSCVTMRKKGFAAFGVRSAGSILEQGELRYGYVYGCINEISREDEP